MPCSRAGLAIRRISYRCHGRRPSRVKRASQPASTVVSQSVPVEIMGGSGARSGDCESQQQRSKPMRMWLPYHGDSEFVLFRDYQNKLDLISRMLSLFSSLPESPRSSTAAHLILLPVLISPRKLTNHPHSKSAFTRIPPPSPSSFSGKTFSSTVQNSISPLPLAKPRMV
jgi:hypothetical protein